MGCFSSCFDVQDADDQETAENDDSNNTNCLCFNFLFQKFKNKLFTNGGFTAVNSSDQGPATVNTNTTTQVNTNNIATTSLPNSSSSSSNSLVQLVVTEVGTDERVDEPRVEANSCIVKGEPKTIVSIDEHDSKDNCAVSRVDVVVSSKGRCIVEDILVWPSSQDEDVCPTCLEEYTDENPKIITKCQHNFHLACIYEWMERSETCPVCMKLMEFSES